MTVFTLYLQVCAYVGILYLASGLVVVQLVVVVVGIGNVARSQKYFNLQFIFDNNVGGMWYLYYNYN